MGKENPESWIDEFIKLWHSSGGIGKILMILSCIGASTTLTSLSGTIVEWRGLIAEMLYVYSQYIRTPIIDFINLITFDLLRISGALVDAILLYIIYFSGEKRVIGKLKERSALNASLFIMIVIVFPVVLLTVVLIILYLLDRYLFSGSWNYSETIAVMIPIGFISLSLYGWVRSIIWLSKGNFPEGLIPESQPILYRNEIRKFLQYATPIIFAFLMLVVFASINLSLA